MPHITNKQYTDATTSDSTMESRTGRAPGGGAVSAGARMSASNLITSAPAEQRNARHRLFSSYNCFSP